MMIRLGGAGAPNGATPAAFAGRKLKIAELVQTTPAFHEFAHAGPRPASRVSRELRYNQAVSRDAIYSELDPVVAQRAKKKRSFRVLETAAPTKEAHLNSPDLGAHLVKRARKLLKAEKKQVQVLISDGLSAEAVHFNIPKLLPVLEDGFTARKISLGKPMLARHGRVKLGEEVAAKGRRRPHHHPDRRTPGGDAHSARKASRPISFIS